MSDGRHVRVLLVEDDETVRRLAARVLTRAAYDVLAAGSGEEALRLCRETKGGIAVVVADVGLPDMRGPDLGRRIRELEPAARILFISGHSPDDLADVARMERAHFLAKPFDPADLLKAVQEAVESRP